MSFTIRNEIGDLAIVRTGLNKFGDEHAISRETVTQLQVALDEMVSNVIKYAWPDGGTHELCVKVTARAKSIQMEIVDDGRPFDPLTVPHAAAEAQAHPRPGGLGIQMTKQLVDHISYFRENERNHVVLTKRYAGGVARSQER